MKYKEGLASLNVPSGVFYNPHMSLCRSLFSLSAGAIGENAPREKSEGEKITLCDGFAASGARGIRYKLENKNVGRLTLIDWSEKAVPACRTNIKLNKLKCAAATKANISKYLQTHSFDFVELDPFGTPAPYLHAALSSFYDKKIGYLSLTATDTAVLCGAHFDACLKVYQATPLNSEFCHENALRILLGKLARSAAEFDLGISLLFSLSHRHYVKATVKLQRGAQHAVASIKTLGYVSYCQKCLYREWGKFPSHKACACGNPLLHAGPMWLGKLWDEKHTARMSSLLKERPYLGEEVQKIVQSIIEEMPLPPFHYDAHLFCKRLRIGAQSLQALESKLKEKGFSFSRTHFSPTGFRTDAQLSEIVSSIKN